MADETTRVDEWVQGRLTGDATLVGLLAGGIHADVAPQGSVFPVVVHQFQGGADVRTATSDGRIMLSALWLIKAIGKSETYLGLRAAADRIDALFEKASGAAGTDGFVFSSTRVTPFRLAEDDEGVAYRHLGGIYRVFAQVP